MAAHTGPAQHHDGATVVAMPCIHTVAISSAVSVAVKGREWQLTLGLPRIMVGARENEQVAVRIGLAQRNWKIHSGGDDHQPLCSHVTVCWQLAPGLLSGMNGGSDEWQLASGLLS